MNENAKSGLKNNGMGNDNGVPNWGALEWDVVTFHEAIYAYAGLAGDLDAFEDALLNTEIAPDDDWSPSDSLGDFLIRHAAIKGNARHTLKAYIEYLERTKEYMSNVSELAESVANAGGSGVEVMRQAYVNKLHFVKSSK